MSAMSASPVKPVLPPTGVNVPPPVATSPPKVGIMPIPPSITIAPTKPPNMNHTAMPLSLIADHKVSQQFPPQSQPPSMQPIPQPLSRTPEKPKDLVVIAAIPMKPTSNGMEGFTASNPIPMVTPALPESIISAVPVPLQKPEPQAPNEVIECNTVPGKVENVVEATAAPVTSTVEPEPEKKEESVNVKTVDHPVEKSTHSVAETQEPLKIQTTAAAAPTTVALSTSSVSSTPTSAPNPSAPVTVPPIKQSTPTPEQTATSTAPSVSRTEATLPSSKPELKVATIPRQATKRKREAKVVPDIPEKKEEKEDDRKSKRVRLPTQPYQSPIPELNIIAKISKSTKATPSKAADDKLIVFYKNEFLAVRNADGGFYVCQAMQNIFKSSPRIRIRWLSQEEGKDTYSPDFYDHTDFDCILTNINLEKVDKEKYRLPQIEQQRTESILKRALDVEKGVSEKPPVTEEHPDGLDLSLFRDESQLKKSTGKSKEKISESDKSDDDDVNSTHDEDLEKDEKNDKKMKRGTAPKTSKRKKKITKRKPPSAEKKTATKSSNSGNKSSVQLSKKKAESRSGTKRKSSVSSNSQPPEKRIKKLEVNTQPSERTNKTRSAEVSVEVKSRRDRRAKSRK